MSSNNNTGSSHSDSANAKVNSNLGTSASRYATPEVKSSNCESPKAKPITSGEATKVQVSRKCKEKARDSVSRRGEGGKATGSGRVSDSFLESVDSSGDSSCEPLEEISDLESDNMDIDPLDIDPLDMSDLEESTFIKTSLASYRIEVGKLTKELTLAIGRNENPAKIGTLQKELDRASKALEILIRSEKLMDSAEPSTPKVTHAFVPPQLPIVEDVIDYNKGIITLHNNG
ncbi:hypothetical protein INT47_002681 [Mucor saturninus]|uniref:Uncharacterized protein n=1 Tax=Mucor saturninus TaxID=64648 RepID=A0A8H7QEP6_9FUNG|nr:hypothetical protein INT47_002681 [Mucor saturninus]